MRTLLIIFLIFFIIPQFVAAAPQDTIFREMKDTLAFKKKLSEASKKLTSIESDFRQLKSMSMLKTPVVSEGYFCYKNRTKVRWEYKAPFSYIIVIDEGKLSVKDESRTNSYDLTSNRAFLEINSKLTSIMDGSILDERTGFRIRFFENDEQYQLELTPVAGGMENYFSAIVVFFDRSDYSVSAIKMLEKAGDHTKIEFYNKKVNQPLSDEKFIVR